MTLLRGRIPGLAGGLVCLLAVGMALAETPAPGSDNPGQALWQPAVFADFPVRIELTDRAAVTRLLETVPLAAFSREDLRTDPVTGQVILLPRITEAEARRLTAAGIAFTRLTDLEQAGRRQAEAAWALVPTKDAQIWTAYPTHAQIGTTFAAYQDSFPTLCRTFSWGQTVLGRELWGLVVSADPQTTAAEPEVRLSSSMHGDEPVGMVMLMNLAEYLLENYGEPGFEDVTSLVDNYEIHIMPLHNPDGYIAGTRVNANGADLNRNYPAPTGGQVSQIETTHFMDYAQAHHFVVSLNGHGGALVMNYPWDYTFALTPDDAALQLLSLEYSTWNLPMYNGWFDQGITNGAEWYVATGTLQDWVYYATDCLDVTLEIGDIKWPAATQLDDVWDDNRESLLHYVKAARYGVNGVVTAEDTGLPLDAMVTVFGNGESVSTDPAHGDYYKLLPTGSFELTFTADGYLPLTVPGVSTVWGTPTVLDVTLEPDPSPVPDLRVVQLTARPNPFNPLTRLDFTVPRTGRVHLAVYDVQGRLVRTLARTDLEAGTHHRVWDGRNEAGSPSASGIYFARLDLGAESVATKLMLVK